MAYLSQNGKKPGVSGNHTSWYITDISGSPRRSLGEPFKVLKCNHQHGHFCHFVYIEYYSAGDIFTKFVKFYPLARFASSRCSELSAAFGDLRACYRGRVRITVALASAVIIYYVLIHNGTQTFVYYCSMEYHWGLVTFRYHMIDDSTVLQ